MKCKKYTKMLYLYRDGELSGPARSQLAQHLEECRACRKKKLEIEQTGLTIAEAGKILPQLENRELLTADIMRSIRRLQRFPQNNLLDFLAFPRVRLALAGLTAVLAGLFFLQEFYVLFRISKLEERFAQQSARQFAPALPTVLTTGGMKTPGAIGAWELRRYLDSLPVGAANGNGSSGSSKRTGGSGLSGLSGISPGGLPWEQRGLLKPQTLQALAKAVRELQEENPQLWEYLQERFPGLAGLVHEDTAGAGQEKSAPKKVIIKI